MLNTIRREKTIFTQPQKIQCFECQSIESSFTIFYSPHTTCRFRIALMNSNICHNITITHNLAYNHSLLFHILTNEFHISSIRKHF